MSKLARVKLKVERAKEHIRDLERAVQDFRESDPYGFRIEDDHLSGDKVHRLHIHRETPDRLALLIGDVVHNLRAALDHLAWQLVIANGKTPKTGAGGTCFPVHDPTSGAKPGKRVVDDISPGAEKLLASIKSQDGTNRDLWTLNQLDIVDKHHLLIVTAFALLRIMPTWKGHGGWKLLRANIESLTPKDGIVDARFDVTNPIVQGFRIVVPVGTQPDGTLPVIEDGVVVSRIIAPVQHESKFDLAFDIAFREPKVVEGKPVLHTLSHLADVVDGVIDQFGTGGLLK